MKILIVTRSTGWMGVHARQFADGFRKLGHEPTLLDYRRCRKRSLPWMAWREDPEMSADRNTRNLLRFVEASNAEAIVVAPAHPMFDYEALKSRFRGPVVFLDMDGPRLPCYAEGTDWVRHVDHVVTVSRVTERALRAGGHDHVLYLPHGVDPDFYAPQILSENDRKRFAAPVACVGRATDRRAAHLAGLDADGVVLWGRRWSRPPFDRDPRLRGCVRKGTDVIGADLAKVYNASVLILSVQREALSHPPTIMNLQTFAVPCSGGCLLTEWVEEIEESFDPGEELLTFRGPEELVEQVQRYAVDVDEALRIGRRGRARCLAEHTHEHRAREFVRLMDL